MLKIIPTKPTIIRIVGTNPQREMRYRIKNIEIFSGIIV